MAIMPLFSTTLGIASDLRIFLATTSGGSRRSILLSSILELILPPFKPATMGVIRWAR